MNSFTQEADPLSHPESTEKGTSNVLSRRLNSILETRLENDKDTLEALKELSTFFTENTLQTRRNLRSKIEKRSLVINEDFLSAFREVKQALDELYGDVTAMNASVQSMTSRLRETKAQTSHLIDQTTKLQAESQKLCLQESTADAFLRRFQLSASQLDSLRGTTVTAEFFSALDRVQTIRADCRVLMHSGHQTASLDIMEQMASYQEMAMERLYRWTQANTRRVEAGDTTPLLTRAMFYLQDRPVLFGYVVEEYCVARRSVLARAFIEALTVGGGASRPIELHAHDPERYLGDMLAWLHQALPGERENLTSLLKGCDKMDVSERIQAAMSSITDGVCHPLRVRVEHTLTGDLSVTTLHCLSNLVRFYRRVIGQTVAGSQLEATLGDLEGSSEGRFLEGLQSHVSAERVDLPPPTDLSPSPGVGRLLRLLREALSGGGVADGRPGDTARVVARVVDPLLAAVNEGAARLPTADSAVYLLNCVHQVQSTLSLYEFMDERLERLQAQAEAQLDTLTSEQASSLVAELNLGPIYTILQEPNRGSLSSIPGVDPAGLKAFLDKLDSFLVMPDALLLPQVGLLLSSAHRCTTQRRAFEVIAAIYRQLYAAVQDPANNYQNPASLMRRTPDEVLQMLIGENSQSAH